MRTYVLEIYTYDGNMYNIDFPYLEFSELLNSWTRFIQIKTVEWKEEMLNIANIKHVSKFSQLRTRKSIDGLKETVLNKTWEDIIISDIDLAFYEK